MKKTLIALLLCTALSATVFTQNASDFKTDGKGTITGYDGWDKVIVIPAQLDGVAVTAIAAGALKNMGFTGITLPVSIKTIGEGAVQSNKLTSISLPAGVYVGKSAFSNNQLTSLTAGNEVTIGQQAFSGNRLTSITVGNKVTIGQQAFSDNQLTGITVGGGSSIADKAFEKNTNLKNLALGANVDFSREEFGIFAYYDYMCNSRKAGTYDKKAEYLDKKDGDFYIVQTKYGVVIYKYGGNEGSRLEIPAQLGGVAVKGISGNYSGRTWKGAFEKTGVSRLRLPEGIVFIGDQAFLHNQLTTVTIPNSVTYIGDRAFDENQLTSVTIGNGVTYIGDWAFSDNQLTSVTIPKSVTSIGRGAFYENKLTSVTIPNSVTSIGGAAFSDNPLTSVTIGANVSLYGFTDEDGDMILPFGNGFDGAYISGGRQAGTYTRSDTSSNTWTKQ